MPIYVKRHWNETRGDQYDAWGTSWWYFEVGTDGWVTRQIEQYNSGMQLRYGPEHEDDEFGGLAQAALTLSEPSTCRFLIRNSMRFGSPCSAAIGQKPPSVRPS